MSEPGKVIQINRPPASAGGDVSRCPVCEYTAGPFVTAQAAAEDYLHHLETRHGRMMVSCECGWRSGPHQERFSGARAFVEHAAAAHGIAVNAGLPKFNEDIARSLGKQCWGLAAALENRRLNRRVQLPGEPPFDAASELLRPVHELLMGMASILDLLAFAATGRPSIVPMAEPAPTPRPSAPETTDGA